MQPTTRVRPFNFAERVMLQHADPVKLGLDCVGIVLSAGLLWAHRLSLALLVLFGLNLLGSLLALRVDLHRLAQTKLGGWMLQQAHPVNLVVRTVGAVVLAVGFWSHAAWLIAAGVVVIVAARWLSPRVPAADDLTAVTPPGSRSRR